MQTEPERLLTIPEVMDWLQVSLSTVNRLTASGSLPCVRILRTVRYSPEAVRAWILAQQRKAKEGEPAGCCNSRSVTP